MSKLHWFYSGEDKYYPKDKERFIGEYVICRSEWERKFAEWCDKNPEIESWSSESLSIRYYDPTSRRRRNYYPDFVLRIKGEIYIVEIKPYKETRTPKITGKKKSTLLTEIKRYKNNLAKWEAAISYCQRRGFKFKIITEKTFNFTKKP